MTRGVYKSALRGMLDGRFDFEHDRLMVTMVRIDQYEADLRRHAVLADIPAEARLQTMPITGARVEDGHLFIDDFTFVAVGFVGPFQVVKGEMVYWIDRDNEKKSPLLFYVGRQGESFGYSGWNDPFPLRLDGGDVTVNFGGSPLADVEPWYRAADD